MKPSGVDWIKETPKDWDIAPLRFHSAMFKGLSIQKTDLVEEGVYVISYGQIHSKANTGTHTQDDLLRCIPRSLVPYGSRSLLKRGDLVFADTSEDVGGVGNEVLIDRDDEIYAGYHSLVCRTDQDFIDGKFFAYLTKTDCWREQLRQYAMGVKVYSVTQSILGRVSLIVPPLEEQHRICKLLDNLTARIDGATDCLTRQISVLVRYKASLIHEIVTKGLDKTVAMKPSGVEWIGDIPEHWDITKVKHVSKSRNGLTYDPADICDSDDEGAVLVLRSSNIQNGKLSLHDNVYVSMKIPSEIVLRRGDIVICSRNGSRELIGKNLYVEQEGLGTLGAFMLLCRSEIGEYLYWVLNGGMFDYYLGSFTTSTVNQLTNSNFKNMMMPLCPNEAERLAICEYLKTKCARIDAVLETKRKQVEVLKKRRASLIYEYVTGKRRVK